MGSFFIVISVPSAEHEKKLWIEENLKSNINEKRIQEKQTFFVKPKDTDSENFFLCRSASDTSVVDKGCLMPEGKIMKKQSQSFVHISNNKDRMTMEKRLEKCLKELKIPNAVWVLGRAGKYYQVSFCSSDGEQCERIIQLFTEHKIGSELNSTVSILPCTLNYEGKEEGSTPSKASPSAQLPPFRSLKETAWDLFVNSVRARIMVAQVVAGVKSNATLTFDFLILLIIASITAAVGLVENSEVILVASMLISPLMGPVMASTFGFATRDWKLQKIGLLNELLGLLLCVVIGFLYGLLVSYLCWESPDFDWPTPEMINRGELRSLLVGALIAVLSGGAVAIAVLGNYSGSLTGVAISASLMPPAVNAGLLWGLAALLAFLGDTNPQKLTAFTNRDPLRELLMLGALSLTLTFINIFCIFLMGVVVLKIKEVTPRGSRDYTRLLWKETIQIARDQKHNLHQSVERMEQGNAANQFPDLLSQPNYHATHKLSLNTWSAYGAMQGLNRPTVQDLAAAWHQCTFHPLTSTNKKIQQINPFQRAPMPHPDVARLLNVVSSPSSTSSFDEHNTAFIGSATPPQLPRTPRFVVTPTDISKIST